MRGFERRHFSCHSLCLVSQYVWPAQRQGTARSYDLALVHSSLVASPLAQALRTQYNIKVVAFGAVKDCGEKGDDYDDWLAFRNGYMPNREMEPFDQMELMRIMALWVHRKDQRALRLWP